MQILSLKTILAVLLGLYLFALVFVFLVDPASSGQNHRGLETLFALELANENSNEDSSTQGKTYRFSDPVLGYKVLSQLDARPKPTDTSIFNANNLPWQNLKVDNDYCDKHYQYMATFPESIFQGRNFLNLGKPLNMIRTLVLTQMGNDLQPYIPPNDKKIYEIKPEANIFFTRDGLFKDKTIGRHYSCITQSSNHVPGKQVLGLKDRFAEEVKEYARRYESRPECFQVDRFYPKTYLLYRANECREFFKIFNSEEYQNLKTERGIVFIKKLAENIHSGKGVEPVQAKQEIELRKFYDNGRGCGKKDSPIIVQTFIHNPLLLNGRKFDFRIYLMLASVNPLIAHYHDGFLRVSLPQYDVNSTDKRVLLTNLGLNYELYQDAHKGVLVNGMTEEELKIAQQWSYERLQDYLLETGVISDPNWLENYLRPQIKKALVHLLRFSLLELNTHSSLFQLYGVDFMLDSDLKLWFIEANSKPGIGEYSKPMEKFISKMLQDHIEIASSLLRARVKRIITYINSLIDEGAVKETEDGKVVIKDLEYRRMVFQKITKNSFDKEFEPSPTNGFSKIIDENYSGVERYQGLLEKECL